LFKSNGYGAAGQNETQIPGLIGNHRDNHGEYDQDTEDSKNNLLDTRSAPLLADWFFLIRWHFNKLQFSFQMGLNRFCQPSRYSRNRPQLVLGRLTDFIKRAKVRHQGFPAAWPNPRYYIQDGGNASFFASPAVSSDGEAVSFIADPLDQEKPL
jgi:hypothetical protein